MSNRMLFKRSKIINLNGRDMFAEWTESAYQKSLFPGVQQVDVGGGLVSIGKYDLRIN